VRAMAAEAMVNHNTVARAYQELARLGATEALDGVGVFVTLQGPEVAAAERARGRAARGPPLRGRATPPHRGGLVEEERMSAVVTVEHVAKRFGKTRVLEDVAFELPEKGVTVLLGENGQGKSTLLRLLLGLLKAERGSIRVLGLDPLEQGRELRRLVGYVPDQPDNPPWMTPRELYRFLRPQYPAWSQER